MPLSISRFHSLAARRWFQERGVRRTAGFPKGRMPDPLPQLSRLIPRLYALPPRRSPRGSKRLLS